MPEQQIIRFGPYAFEPRAAELCRGTRVLPLTRKAGEVLRCLVTTVCGVTSGCGLVMASVSSSTGRAKRYLPLLDALERLCRNPGGERLVTLLAQYAPSWVVQLPGLLSASALADLQHTLAGTTRARMQRELSVALEAASATQPLVLVLEDLHWSDPSTVEALAMLARRREPARLLVVGTYRAAEVVMREHLLQPMKHELLRQGRAVCGFRSKVHTQMRQVHHAGDKCFVDYAGQKPRLIEAATGAVTEVELFVAVLGASNYTYAEATRTQQIPDWLASHQRAFEFFGGSPPPWSVTSSRVASPRRAGTSRSSNGPTRSSRSITAP